ncbi:MAG: hypothetical protein NZL93_00975, partial [Chthoniobacterales bacterium]|nr:hypothetical protein [Chthoniobacterales bacterium]
MKSCGCFKNSNEDWDMRFWLIDVGNTFTKIAEVAEVNQRDKARKGGIGKVERIPTSVFGVSAMERVV